MTQVQVLFPAHRNPLIIKGFRFIFGNIPHRTPTGLGGLIRARPSTAASGGCFQGAGFPCHARSDRRSAARFRRGRHSSHRRYAGPQAAQGGGIRHHPGRCRPFSFDRAAPPGVHAIHPRSRPPYDKTTLRPSPREQLQRGSLRHAGIVFAQGIAVPGRQRPATVSSYWLVGT